MKRFFLPLLMMIALGCSQTSAPSKDNDQKSTSTTEITKSTTPASAHDGTYVFDMETYRQVQLANADSVFKNMKPEDIDRLMQVFKPFKIEVAGQTATASFSHDVIKGELKTLEQSGTTAKLFMTPLDVDKKDQTVTLIITGTQMVLDPGKNESDKMFFKKVDK